MNFNVNVAIMVMVWDKKQKEAKVGLANVVGSRNEMFSLERVACQNLSVVNHQLKRPIVSFVYADNMNDFKVTCIQAALLRQPIEN